MAEKNRFTRRVTQDNYVSEKIDVLENNLLGTYDADGEYVLAPQIVKELLSLEKVKKRTFANSVFCVGNLLGYGELIFELVFDEKTHNGKSASATLYLLEDVHKINGYLQNTIKSRIEHFNENVDNFIEATYKFFNIKAEEDDEDDDAEVLERKLKDDLDLEDSYIIAKKQYSLMLLKLTEEKLLDAYGKYFTARISALTKLDNEFSRAVLDSFNGQYALIQNIFLKEKNYEMLNELLDKSIEELSGVNAQFIIQEQQFENMVKPALETFQNSVDKIKERYQDKALNSLAKSDRKKVEAIFEDSKDIDLVEPEVHTSNQSAKRIVNELSSGSSASDKSSEGKEQKSNDFVSEMKQRKNASNQQSSQTAQSSSRDDSFYSNFKQQRAAGISAPSGAPSKVVDTSRSSHIDSQPMAEEVAASSLRDRMTRLEKFKSQPQMGGTLSGEQTQESGDSFYDMLSREKAKKEQQIDSKLRRDRASFDSITQEADQQTQVDLMRQRQQMMRERQSMDMGEM